MLLLPCAGTSGNLSGGLKARGSIIICAMSAATILPRQPSPVNKFYLCFVCCYSRTGIGRYDQMGLQRKFLQSPLKYWCQSLPHPVEKKTYILFVGQKPFSVFILVLSRDNSSLALTLFCCVVGPVVHKGLWLASLILCWQRKGNSAERLGWSWWETPPLCALGPLRQNKARSAFLDPTKDPLSPSSYSWGGQQRCGAEHFPVRSMEKFHF